MLAAGLERFVRDARAVGAHVGDESDRSLLAQFHALIQALGQHHGPLGGVMEAKAGLLLQRAGGEGRRRFLLPLFLLHLADNVFGSFECRHDAHGIGFIVRFEFLAGPFGQLRKEGSLRDFRLGGGFGLAVGRFFLLAGLRFGRFPHRAFGSQESRDLPVLFRLEVLDLALALDDQADRDRLHAAGAEVAG